MCLRLLFKNKLAVAAVGMGLVLLYGCFFLFGGAWIYLSGYGTRPARLDLLMIGVGVSIIIIGTIIVYANYKKQEETEKEREEERKQYL